MREVTALKAPPLGGGWEQRAGSGILVPVDPERAFVDASSAEDEWSAMLREASGVESKYLVYEFPGSEGGMMRGPAIGGVQMMAELRWEKKPLRVIMHGINVSEVEMPDGARTRVFTVALNAEAPDGGSAPGVASAEECPKRRDGRGRYFNKHAAPTATACAMRNAIRRMLPRRMIDSFVADVLAAKHGPGRVKTITHQAAEESIPQDWLDAQKALHKALAALGVRSETSKRAFHAAMCKEDSKLRGPKDPPLTSTRQMSAQRIALWAGMIEKIKANTKVHLTVLHRAGLQKPEPEKGDK